MSEHDVGYRQQTQKQIAETNRRIVKMRDEYGLTWEAIGKAQKAKSSAGSGQKY